MASGLVRENHMREILLARLPRRVDVEGRRVDRGRGRQQLAACGQERRLSITTTVIRGGRALEDHPEPQGEPWGQPRPETLGD